MRCLETIDLASFLAPHFVYTLTRSIKWQLLAKAITHYHVCIAFWFLDARDLATVSFLFQ